MVVWKFGRREKDIMVKIYNAADAIEAERVVAELKECGIPAYYQDSSSSVVGYGVTGFGLYGVDVYVDESDGERAKRIVEEVVAEEDEEVG